MALFTLRDRLEKNELVLSAWMTLTDPLVNEAFARADFDALTLDAQHGLHDTASLRQAIERAILCGKPALVRLPIDDHALAARVLDFGASGVIMPMIETAEDASAFVRAVKYPPLGQRSYGPTRASQLHGYADGMSYVSGARTETVAFAMIETVAAMTNLEAILALDGLDGVFVGPSDLSIALSGDGTLDPGGSRVEAAIDEILAAAANARKLAAIYGITPSDVQRYRDKGYRYICVGSDFGVVTAGAAALAAASRA